MKKTINKIFDVLMTILKDQLVKKALKALLGTASAGGIKGYIVKYIAVELYEEVAEPLFKLLRRNGFLLVDKATGEIRIKKIDKAKVEKNEKNYIDNISSI